MGLWSPTSPWRVNLRLCPTVISATMRLSTSSAKDCEKFARICTEARMLSVLRYESQVPKINISHSIQLPSFQANEIILKAKSCTNPEEKECYLQSALKVNANEYPEIP